MSKQKEEELLNLLKGVKYLDTNQIARSLGIGRRYARQLIDSLYLAKKIKINGPAKNPLWHIVQ